MHQDENSMEAEVRELFGVTEDAGDTTPNSSATDTTNPTNPAPQENTEGSGSAIEGTQSTTLDNKQEPAPNTTSTEDTQLNPEDKFNKQNSAFAQMRIQNREYADLIMNLAKATGQVPKDLSEAQAMLKEGLNKVVAKNRNIPEDVLREMDEDKKALAELRQAQARQNALSGFQKVKDLYGLSREDVNKFADKLIEQKINPFEQQVDLIKEYRNIYYEDLIAKAKEAGIQEERQRSLKASNNSTTPSTTNGGPENTGNQVAQIKTVAELDKLLESLK